MCVGGVYVCCVEFGCCCGVYVVFVGIFVVYEFLEVGFVYVCDVCEVG